MKNILKILLVLVITFFSDLNIYADVPYEVFKTQSVSEVTIRNSNNVIVKDGKAVSENSWYTKKAWTVDKRVKTKLSGINYKLEFRNVWSMWNEGWTSLGWYDKAKLTISYIIEKAYHLYDTGVAHPMFENNNFFEEAEDEIQYIDDIELDLVFDWWPYGSFRIANKDGSFSTVWNIVDWRYAYLANIPNNYYGVWNDVQIPIEEKMFEEWMNKLVDPPCRDSWIRFSDYNWEVTYWLDVEDRDSFNIAELDAILCVDTIISTWDDSTCVLSLADMTTFKMKPNSDIILSNPKEESKVELIGWKILVNIKRMFKGQSIDVKMSQAMAWARWTIFELEETWTESKIKVFEWAVEFTSNSTWEKSLVWLWETQGATSEWLLEKTSKDDKEVFKKINKERQEWEKIKETPLNTLLTQEEINKIRVRDPDRDEIPLDPGSIAPNEEESSNMEVSNESNEEVVNEGEYEEESGSNTKYIILILVLSILWFMYMKKSK